MCLYGITDDWLLDLLLIFRIRKYIKVILPAGELENIYRLSNESVILQSFFTLRQLFGYETGFILGCETLL